MLPGRVGTKTPIAGQWPADGLGVVAQSRRSLAGESRLGLSFKEFDCWLWLDQASLVE